MAKSKLYFRYGVMNSAKSLFLMSTAHSFKTHNIKCLILKSSMDTRDQYIKSRAIADPMECDVITPETDITKHVISYLVSTIEEPLKWILVDEAQFLTPKQVDELAYIVDEMGINVICYGLRTDFQTNLFPGSKRLFELADTIEEMKTTCNCGNKASINARIDSNGNIVMEGEQVECGAEDKYVTMCRKCFNRILIDRKLENEKN